MLKSSCKFFNTTGKCRFGKHCKYSHDIETSPGINTGEISNHEAVNKVNRVEASACVSVSSNSETYSQNGSLRRQDQSQESSRSLDSSSQSVQKRKDEGLSNRNRSTRDHNLCRFFAKNRFCHFGRRCRYQHVLPSREAASADDVQEEKLPSDVISQDKQFQHDDEQDQVQNEGALVVDADDVIEDKIASAKLSSQPRQPKQRLCRFFKRGYCRFGKKCNFFHAADSQSNQEVQNVADKPENGIETEEKCEVVAEVATVTDDGFKQVVRKPRIILSYERKDVDEEKQKSLRDTEILQLKRRFPKDKLKIVEETDDKAVYIFTFIPSDPDWPFDVNTFDIQVNIGQEYPLKLFEVSLPLDQDLPETVRRYIEVCLHEWVSKKEKDDLEKGTVQLLFRPFLRWMDRDMENIVTQALRQLRRELTAKAAGLQFFAASDLRKDRDNTGSCDDTDGATTGMDSLEMKDARAPVAYRKRDYIEQKYEAPAKASSEENSEASDEEDSGDTENKDHQRPAIAADTERRGTELVFRNMQIWYCTTVMVEKLRLTVQCERCKNRSDFTTPPNRVNSLLCGKCNNKQLVVFRPVLAHSYSSTFGYLDVDGCVAFDVILQDCHLSMGCIMCTRDILVKKFSPGRVLDIFCRGCHNKMQFAAESVKLQFITSAGVDASKFSGNVHQVSVKKAGRVGKDPAIQEGKPLPNNGSCKHYKKSYRWLRFPCCGKCYPCDVCHDDEEDHDMVFANRMICGFCCKEQVFAAERPCTGCGSALTKVHTAHWEGGKGCRNKITMSRLDEKKYTNMSKTVSNKAKSSQDKSKTKKNDKLRHTQTFNCKGSGSSTKK